MLTFTPDFERFTFAETATEVRRIVNKNICKITFTKVDGTLRTFERATTDLGNIPSDKQPKGDPIVKDPLQIRVFVLELNEWRSFKVDLLKVIEILPE